MSSYSADQCIQLCRRGVLRQSPSVCHRSSTEYITGTCTATRVHLRRASAEPALPPQNTANVSDIRPATRRDIRANHRAILRMRCSGRATRSRMIAQLSLSLAQSASDASSVTCTFPAEAYKRSGRGGQNCYAVCEVP